MTRRIGDYHPSYWYRYGDVVQYDGSSYASLIPLNLDNTPGGENSAWGLVASQGATGSQGIQGIQGETGLQGIQGTQGVQGDTGDTGPSVGSTRNVVTDEISAPDGFSVTTVSCTGTDVAMSGGWQVPNAGMTVIHSFPAATASDWTFKLNNSSGSAQTVVLYVVCIDGGNAPV